MNAKRWELDYATHFTDVPMDHVHNKDLRDRLSDGWEPFATAGPLTDSYGNQYVIVHFRRPRANP